MARRFNAPPGLLAWLRGSDKKDGGRERTTALVVFAVGLVAGCGGPMTSPEQVPTVPDLPPVATPAPATTSLAQSPTSSPTPEPTIDSKARAKAEASAKAKNAAEARRRAAAKARSKGSSATFEHFRVTVTQVSRDASQVRLRAKVCVTSLPPDPQGNRTRISWDPWSIRAGSRAIEPDLQASPLKDEFPADATYRVGQCAAGWIPFATSSALSLIHI